MARNTSTDTDVPRDLLAALAESLGLSVDLAVARYRFPIGSAVRVPIGAGTRRHMVDGTVVDVMDYGPWPRFGMRPAGVNVGDPTIVLRVDLGARYGVRDYGAGLAEVA